MFKPVSVLKYHRKPFSEGSFLVMRQVFQNNCWCFFEGGEHLLGLEFDLLHPLVQTL